MKRGRRGSVLAYVLVTSVVVAIIVSGIVRMLLMRYMITQRLQDGATAKAVASSGYQQMMGAWNKTNTFCASFGLYTCSGCNPCTACTGAAVCTCTSTNSKDPTITIKYTGGLCQVTSVAPSPP